MGGTDYTKSLTRETQLPRNPRRNYGLAKGRDIGVSPEKVTCAKNALPYNELSEDARGYAVFTDGSSVVGNHGKAAVWSPTGQVTESAEAEAESSQLLEVRAIKLALELLKEKSGLYFILTPGWWLMPCGGDCSSGRTAIGNTG